METQRATRRRHRILAAGILALLVAIYACLLGIRVLWPVRYADIIEAEAEAFELDPGLVGAIVFAESRYRAHAVSPRGALGLMQLMPSTGLWLADQLELGLSAPDDLLRPEINIRLGTWYLASLLERFGDTRLALWAYNAGPANVERWLEAEEMPYTETAAYADRVISVRWIYGIYFRNRWVRSLTPSLVF